MLNNKKHLKRVISAAADRQRNVLQDAVDEMGVPSYLSGNAVSRFFFWGKLHIVLRLAELERGHRVLDFGCGSGVLLPDLSRDGRLVVATDQNLQIARDVAGELELPRIQFLGPDRLSADVADGSMDRIIAANVLEHIEDRLSLLRLFVGKLRPDGMFVVSGPTENRAYRFGRWIIGFRGDYHVGTVDDVFADVERAGFRRRRIRHWPCPGPACLYKIAAFTPDERGREIHGDAHAADAA